MKQITLMMTQEQVGYIEGAAAMLGWTKGEIVRVLIELGKVNFEAKYFNGLRDTKKKGSAKGQKVK